MRLVTHNTLETAQCRVLAAARRVDAARLVGTVVLREEATAE